MQSETNMRYHFTPTRMAIIKKIFISEGVEKLDPLFTACGTVKCCNHFGKESVIAVRFWWRRRKVPRILSGLLVFWARHKSR